MAARQFLEFERNWFVGAITSTLRSAHEKKGAAIPGETIWSGPAGEYRLGTVMLNRRHFLALGGAVGGAVLVPKVAGRRASSGPALLSTASRAAVTPFAVRMPVPAVLAPTSRHGGTDFYDIGIQQSTADILPGLSTPIYGFNGQFVGPTIRARTGRRAKVTFRNALDVPANVHLHGAHVPASSDGHPMDLITPGQQRLYDYPNTQQGATLWYHDHAHGLEAEHVYRGLHGFYLIDDPAEDHLRLPSGAYDVPIMLRDGQFTDSGEFVLYHSPADRTTILANGKPQPYFPVAARKYRFRLLNGATERVFNLSLGGQPMTQIASDGGLLPAPVERTALRISSAERTEVVIDFSRYPIGTQLVLSDATAGPVLRFDVVRPALDLSRVPSHLRALPALPRATVTRDVALSFDMTGPLPVGLVNGVTFDPDRVDFRIKRGTTEIWRITNADTTFGFLHTFHMHLVQFRVLDRDGLPPTQDEKGRKDTVVVPPGSTVRVQATFGDYLGRYMYHCHFLEHSSLGMMGQMEIVA
jgi:spore coat protein A